MMIQTQVPYDQVIKVQTPKAFLAFPLVCLFFFFFSFFFFFCFLGVDSISFCEISETSQKNCNSNSIPTTRKHVQPFVNTDMYTITFLNYKQCIIPAILSFFSILIIRIVEGRSNSVIQSCGCNRREGD